VGRHHLPGRQLASSESTTKVDRAQIAEGVVGSGLGGRHGFVLVSDGGDDNR
jgi:hypothetical protein